MTALLFWASVGLVAYAYAGYPLLLMLRAYLFPRPVRCADITPRVTLIVCAHNEANDIAAKLENLLSLDYPSDRLDIVIASDGSTDGTDDVVRGFPQVKLLSLPRRGKIPTLNVAVAAAKGEILVFSDANSMYERTALRALLRPFADPGVGGVAGDQRYLPEQRGVEAGRGERS